LCSINLIEQNIGKWLHLPLYNKEHFEEHNYKDVQGEAGGKGWSSMPSWGVPPSRKLPEFVLWVFMEAPLCRHDW
jgi:hypothetical protein